MYEYISGVADISCRRYKASDNHEGSVNSGDNRRSEQTVRLH